MPNQSKIIYAVNSYLKQLPNVEFEFNKTGICAGIAAVFIKYALQDKTEDFFKKLEHLSKLSTDYHFGKDHFAENFIGEIERAFNPFRYQKSSDVGDLDKLLDINGNPLRNEFNLGLITDEIKWVNILSQISRENRAYYLTSHNHAIALIVKKGKFIIYDPNYHKTTKVYHNAQEALEEIKQCFGYKASTFPLAIRTFAKATDKPCLDYPPSFLLHQEIFESSPEKLDATFKADSFEYSSQVFACEAKDQATTKYLLDKGAMNLDQLLPSECRSPYFISLLLAKPKSDQLKLVLIQCIQTNIFWGEESNVAAVLSHYNRIFTAKEEQEALKNTLKETFKNLAVKSLRFQGYLTTPFGLMDKKGDHSYLIKLYDDYQLVEDKNSVMTANYLFLKLITLINQEHESDDHPSAFSLISQLSLQQLLDEIQLAATYNHDVLLKLLLKRYVQLKPEPDKGAGIFSKELIQQIHPRHLKAILDNGIHVNPELLSECVLRQNKEIFKQYVQAVLRQTGKQDLLEQMDKHFNKRVDLATPVGNINLLSILIFLKEKKRIQEYLDTEIDVEIIKGGLFYAILLADQETSVFLQKQLYFRQSGLGSDTTNFLIEQAIKDENNAVLLLLAQLNYNVLQNTTDLKAILDMAWVVDNYTVIEKSFLVSSTAIKKQILDYALSYRVQPLFQLCVQKSPQLFFTAFTEWLEKPDSPERDEFFLRVDCHFASPVLTKAQEPLVAFVKSKQPKEFIHYCFEHNLVTIAAGLVQHIHWSSDELNAILTKVIQSRKTKAIIQLLEAYPNLRHRDNLILDLLTNKLFDVVDYLLVPDFKLSPRLANQLFEEAIANNNTRVIKKLLERHDITPETPLSPPLLEQLKRAIENDSDKVVDLFVSSEKDFGLNFKELFLHCCEFGKPSIANQLLAKPIPLSEKDVPYVVKLFGNKSTSGIYESIYKEGYGRLYVFLNKVKIPALYNPRATLMSSIRSPELDSNVSLALFKRAIKDKNKTLFDKLANQIEWDEISKQELLTLIESNPASPLLNLFENKYGWEALLATALQHRQFGAAAFILERHSAEKLAPLIKEQLVKNSRAIVEAFIQYLIAQSSNMDVRPRLFKLLDTQSSPNALKELAKPFRDLIHSSMKSIEEEMIKNNKDLNGTVYRFQLNFDEFKQALQQLSQLFDSVLNYIAASKIQLGEDIEDKKVVELFAEIKNVMARNGVTPYYLSEEHSNLLEQLVENPRFKLICELEIKLYAALQQLNGAKKPFNEYHCRQQELFNEGILSLGNALSDNKLTSNFVVQELKIFLDQQQQRQLEIERQQQEKQHQLEMERQQQEKQRQLEVERQQQEKQRQLEIERQQQEKQRQLEIERQQQEKQRQLEIERQQQEKQRQLEIERQQQEKQRQLDVERQKNRVIDDLIKEVNNYLSIRKDEPESFYWWAYNKTDKMKAATHFIEALKNPSLIISEREHDVLSNGRLNQKISNYLRQNQHELKKYFKSTKPINHLDTLIKVLNQREPISKLITLLENYSKERASKPEKYHFSIFPQYSGTEKRQAVAKLISLLHGENTLLSEKDLGALNQGSLGKIVGGFIESNKSSLKMALRTKQMSDVMDLAEGCQSYNKSVYLTPVRPQL